MKSIPRKEYVKWQYCVSYFNAYIGKWCMNDTFNFKRKKDAAAMGRSHYPNCKIRVFRRSVGNWELCK